MHRTVYHTSFFILSTEPSQIAPRSELVCNRQKLQCRSGNVLADPIDCSKYYTCTSGRYGTTSTACLSGGYFDSVNTRCTGDVNLVRCHPSCNVNNLDIREITLLFIQVSFMIASKTQTTHTNPTLMKYVNLYKYITGSLIIKIVHISQLLFSALPPVPSVFQGTCDDTRRDSLGPFYYPFVPFPAREYICRDNEIKNNMLIVHGYVMRSGCTTRVPNAKVIL